MSNRNKEADWDSRQTPEDLSLVDQIKTFTDAMVSSGVTELTLSEDGLNITLKRRPLSAPAAVPQQSARGGEPVTPEAAVAPAELTLAVMAPLSGVFYTTPSPSEPAFTQVGEIVQPGQVVCMVEAMKVFNEIKTEIGGTVVAIPPKNGQLVKKGDPLVRIKPA